MARIVDKVAELLKPTNPCHSSEESLAWRIMCVLFPECWCCSGIRGIIYGVVLTLIVVKILG